MGKVYFVGAGPGAADLITVRGARLLAHCDVVLYDALTDPALRELAPAAQWIDVGKRGFAHAMRQAQINALLVQHAQQCACVVRLKGGDPSLFGRLEEELEALGAHGIDCEVVPGITAALAAAATTQRPLTRRGRGRSADSEVYYMAGRQLAALSGRLLAGGWAPHTPVCVVSRAGCSDPRISEHRLDALAHSAALHAERATVVTVGVAATPVRGAGRASAHDSPAPSAIGATP